MRRSAEVAAEPVGEPEYKDLEQTNWWIITGGPSTGKTALLANLAHRGYRTRSEAARDYIDEQLALGKSLDDIRGGEREIDFQEAVLRLKEQRERLTSKDALTFWDRGADGDSMAYWTAPFGRKPKIDSRDMYEPEVVIERKTRYRGIFLLDRLAYKSDYARTEDEALAAWVHGAIGAMYQLLGYESIRVPVFPGRT